VTGPDFAAVMTSTYVVSGSIDIGNNVDITMTVALDTGTGACSLIGVTAENTVINYSCTTSAGANHLFFTISPWCSTGGGSKKYSLSSSGEATTNGTGSIVIDLGNVAGNITKNIAIDKSNSNC